MLLCVVNAGFRRDVIPSRIYMGKPENHKKTLTQTEAISTQTPPTDLNPSFVCSEIQQSTLLLLQTDSGRRRGFDILVR